MGHCPGSDFAILIIPPRDNNTVQEIASVLLIDAACKQAKWLN
ncbi:hypothetical protein W04_1339 [Pseudoalteromonas sp. SW0106-04]|nr:hypothetical protein W04_1339 [Pseudoalteromonas sp. SW0106-04]